MLDCFSVPDAGARCSSACAATGVSSSAPSATSPETNRCARQDAGISNRVEAGIVMLSAATGAGAVNESIEKKCRCR